MVAMVAFFIIVGLLLGECWKIPGHEDSSVLLERGSWVLRGLENRHFFRKSLLGNFFFCIEAFERAGGRENQAKDVWSAGSAMSRAEKHKFEAGYRRPCRVLTGKFIRT
jgi:hypothetical protein